MPGIVIITRGTHDARGYQFWNGDENVTQDVREIMARALEDEATRTPARALAISPEMSYTDTEHQTHENTRRP